MDRKEKAAVNGLAVASLVFGILAILTSWTVIPAVMNALFALMFASLSKGCRKKCGIALAGMLLALSAIVIALIAAAVFFELAVDFVNSLSGSREEMLRDLLDALPGLKGV